MAKLLLEVELDYDDQIYDPDDPESRAWFFDEILRTPKDLILHSNTIGDTIGTVTVKSYRTIP